MQKPVLILNSFVYLFASITLSIRRMTRTVFDHIVEYGFEDDKKYLKMYCTFNIIFFEVFLDTKKT